MLYELGFTDKDREAIHDNLVRREERERIIDIARGQMCLGWLEDASCDHELCLGLAALISKLIREGK